MRPGFLPKSIAVLVVGLSTVTAACALPADSTSEADTEKIASSKSAVGIVVPPDAIMEALWPKWMRTCVDHGITYPKRYFVETADDACVDRPGYRGHWDGRRLFPNTAVRTCVYSWNPDDDANPALQDGYALARHASEWVNSHPNIRADCAPTRPNCSPLEGTCATAPTRDHRKQVARGNGPTMTPGCPLCGEVINDTLVLVLPEVYTDESILVAITAKKKGSTVVSEQRITVVPGGEQVLAIPLAGKLDSVKDTSNVLLLDPATGLMLEPMYGP